jgi:uncharacterized membrane protein YdcZ (DUF606 family)
MLQQILVAPSLSSLFVTGFLLLYIFYLLVTQFKQFVNLDFYKKISLLALLVGAVGVHGLIHIGVEDSYDFNPYKWI